MKDEIKEMNLSEMLFNRDERLLDYITNLQQKTNNQSEEINRLYKQREKFMKKYGYLKEEKNNYKSRNEKAIKCIKDKYYKEEYERKGTFTNKLMNILQGEDKDVEN